MDSCRKLKEDERMPKRNSHQCRDTLRTCLPQLVVNLMGSSNQMVTLSRYVKKVLNKVVIKLLCKNIQPGSL